MRTHLAASLLNCNEREQKVFFKLSSQELLNGSILSLLVQYVSSEKTSLNSWRCNQRSCTPSTPVRGQRCLRHERYRSGNSQPQCGRRWPSGRHAAITVPAHKADAGRGSRQPSRQPEATAEGADAASAPQHRQRSPASAHARDWTEEADVPSGGREMVRAVVEDFFVE